MATPDAQPEGAATLAPGTKLQLLNVTLQDGRMATAVFTAPERAAGTFGEVGYIAMQGRTLFEMIRQNPAMLNPGHGYGVVWEPSNLTAMLGLPVERVIEKATQVMLGSPAQPPTQLIDRLKDIFGAMPEVDAAWLAIAAWADRTEQTWYLDVRSSAADHDPIRRALSQAIEGADLQGRPVDMVIKSAGGAASIGITIKAPKKRGC